MGMRINRQFKFPFFYLHRYLMLMRNFTTYPSSPSHGRHSDYFSHLKTVKFNAKKRRKRVCGSFLFRINCEIVQGIEC